MKKLEEMMNDERLELKFALKKVEEKMFEQLALSEIKDDLYIKYTLIKKQILEDENKSFKDYYLDYIVDYQNETEYVEEIVFLTEIDKTTIYDLRELLTRLLEKKVSAKLDRI